MSQADSGTAVASPESGASLDDSPARSQPTAQSSTNSTQGQCPLAAQERTDVPIDPCYLYKMVIREEWPGATEEQQKQDEAPDPAELDGQIEEKEKRLWQKRAELDEELLKDRYRPIKVVSLRVQRDRLQSELLELIARRSSAAPFTVEQPSKLVREFTILKTLPADYEEQLKAADATLKELREDLQFLMGKWHQVHLEHEEAKKELLEFSRKLEAAAEEKDKCRAASEAARRDRDTKQEYHVAYANKTHSTGKWKTFKRRVRNLVGQDPASLYAKAQEAFQEALAKYAVARLKYEALATTSLDEIKAREKKRREEGYALIKEIRAKIAQIEEQEKSVIEQRNTHARGGEPIQMVGGAAGSWWTPWNLSTKTWEESIVDGKVVKKAPSDDEPTPTVTVKVDSDNKPDAPADDYKSYCTTPVHNKGHRHPYLRVKEKFDDFRPDDVIEGEAGAELKFKAWQFRQFDKGAERVEYTRFFGLGASLEMVKTFYRLLQFLMSGNPHKRYYDVRALTCGYFKANKPSARTTAGAARHAGTLSKTIEVFPSDGWEVTLRASAFAGTGYEYEQKVQDASRPAAETGNLQYESSGSKKEVTVSETLTEKTMWGTQSTATTHAKIYGYDESGTLEKSIESTQVQTRDGSHVERSTTASGTFQGSAYQGSATESIDQDFSGNASSVQRTVSESGAIVSRTGPDGQPLSLDAYREAHGAESPYAQQSYQSPSGAKLSRAPTMPGSFFPMCPVDLSFKRNAAEDPVTQNIKNCVGTIVYLIRKTADCVGRVGNIVPSYGWKFGFQCDFLSGSLSYFHQFREHVDRRVYLYRKGTLDVRVVTIKAYLFGGFWVEFIIGEIKAGAEINVNGNIGIRGYVENTHPDAQNSVNIGFGPTGGIGCGAEIMVIVGSADWCRAAGGVRTSISAGGTFWLKHTEGPHFDYDIKFDGVQLYVVGHLVLVGTWEKVWHVAKERTIRTGRFPEPFDEKELEAQSAEMDKHCREDAEAAARAEERWNRAREEEE